MSAASPFPCHPSPRHLVAYVLLTTAALYTQYYAVFLPIGLTLYAVWRWRHDLRSLLVWLAAQAIVALLYLPWVLYAAPKLVPYVGQKVVADADRSLGSRLPGTPSVSLPGRASGGAAGAVVAGCAAAARSVGNRLGLVCETAGRGWSRECGSDGASSRSHPHTLRSHRQTPVPLLATVILTALVLGWLIGLRFPFFPDRGERLLLLALPPFILLAAAGLDALWARWRAAGYITLGLVVATSVASLAAFYTVPRYPDDDYRPLIAHTVEQGLPEDTVFAVYPWQVGYWRSYGEPGWPDRALSPDSCLDPRGRGRVGRCAGARTGVVPRASGPGRHPGDAGRGAPGRSGSAVRQRVAWAEHAAERLGGCPGGKAGGRAGAAPWRVSRCLARMPGPSS